jgi:hypothetical protein
VKQCVNIRPQNVVKHVSYVEACPRTVLEPRPKISGDPTIILPSPPPQPNSKCFVTFAMYVSSNISQEWTDNFWHCLRQERR